MDQLKLLWEQDFENTFELDLMTWSFDLGDGSAEGIPGWGNQERENYTENSLKFRDRNLVIEASRYLDVDAPELYYGKGEWQSAKIHTLRKRSFKYGRIEIVAQAPVGKGTWPAFWMLGTSIVDMGWPKCGEIDVLEIAGNRPYQLCGTIHGPGFSGDLGIGKTLETPYELSDSFHTYGIDWVPDSISWHYDGEIYFSLNRNDNPILEKNWPFNDDFYLILNLAMGGWFAGPIEADLNNADFRIKSIKHYSLNEIGETWTSIDPS